MATEQILAIPTTSVAALIPQGLVKVNETELLDLVAREGKFYDRTPELENNTALKQIIPYVFVSHQGKILMYQRAKISMEKRLHGKYSLGFGGHTNTQDMKDGVNPVILGRAREVAEEVTLPHEPHFEFIGALNISRAPIDQFHLGVVYRAEVQTPEYTINEPESFAWSGWSTPEEIAQKFESLESWSQEVFMTLFPEKVPAAAK